VLVCRLPLYTLFRQPEPPQLRNLMRVRVRPRTRGIPFKTWSPGFSRGVRRAPEAALEAALCGGARCFATQRVSAPAPPLKQKRNLSPERRPPSPGSRASPPPRRRGAGMFARFPFPAGRPRAATAARWAAGPPVRADSRRANRCSPANFFYVSLARSRRNNCYSYQDLHQRPFHARSRGALRHNLRALLLCPPSRGPGGRLRIGPPLERHEFSGPVHSAGGLLHTPWRIPTSMVTVLLSGCTDAFSGIS